MIINVFIISPKLNIRRNTSTGLKLEALAHILRLPEPQVALGPSAYCGELVAQLGQLARRVHGVSAPKELLSRPRRPLEPSKRSGR